MENKLEPQEIVRSEMGTWTHSVYADHMNSTFGDKEFATKDEWEAFKNSLSIETVTLWMESSVNPDDWEIMMDACDISKWDPIAPNGFFLIDINFSEDDAYAIFARNKHESEMA